MINLAGSVKSSRRALLDACRRNAVDVITSSACLDPRVVVLCTSVGDACRRTGIDIFPSKTGRSFGSVQGNFFVITVFGVLGERGCTMRGRGAARVKSCRGVVGVVWSSFTSSNLSPGLN